MIHGVWFHLGQEQILLIANGSIRLSENLMEVLIDTRHD
jgi:hypothetical protein